MATRTFLHVGPPKTGTTFLQSGWRSQRQRLLDAGLLHPGTEPADQFRACVLALRHATFTRRMDESRSRLWDDFRTQIAAHEADALLSSEFYARADAPTAARIVSELHEVSREVHVVITARDLGRQVLASWQQNVKRGDTRTLQQFWDDHDPDGGRPWKFWRNQDVPALAQRWLDAGADAVTLVVVDPPGASKDLLWRDMCDLLGLDPDPVPVPRRSNGSLGAVEIEVLRRVNLALPPERDRVRTANVTSKFLSDELAALGLPRVPVGVPAYVVERVLEHAAVQRTRLEKMAADGDLEILGDLDDLTPRIEARESHVDEGQVARAATAVLAQLVVQRLETNTLAREQRQEIRTLRQQLGVRASLRRIARQLVRRADRAPDADQTPDADGTAPAQR